MNPKPDCQELSKALTQRVVFFVNSSLLTKTMSQNHLKIEHLEIGSRCYGYQNLRTRCHLQGKTANKVSFTSIHHSRTFRVVLRCMQGRPPPTIHAEAAASYYPYTGGRLLPSMQGRPPPTIHFHFSTKSSDWLWIQFHHTKTNSL